MCTLCTRCSFCRSSVVPFGAGPVAWATPSRIRCACVRCLYASVPPSSVGWSVWCRSGCVGKTYAFAVPAHPCLLHFLPFFPLFLLFGPALATTHKNVCKAYGWIRLVALFRTLPLSSRASRAAYAIRVVYDARSQTTTMPRARPARSLAMRAAKVGVVYSGQPITWR